MSCPLQIGTIGPRKTKEREKERNERKAIKVEEGRKERKQIKKK